MTRLLLPLAVAFALPLLAGGPLSAKSECESCKDIVGQFCKILDDVRGSKKKQPIDCDDLADKRCASKCNDEEMTAEPAEEDEPAPTTEEPTPIAEEPAEEKIEDHPCFTHCASTCGGPTAEARDACVLECLQTTSCRPPEQ